MSTKHDDTTDDEQHETAADPNVQAPDNGGYERAGQDFESDIDPRAVRVPDHPVKVYPKVRGEQKEAAAYLVTQGDIAEYAEEADEEADAADFGMEAIVELLNTKYVSPEFSLSVEDYKQAPAGYYDEFFNQIVPELGN